MRDATALLAGLLCCLVGAVSAIPISDKVQRVRITQGEFSPLYGVRSADVKIRVGTFLIDDIPVTNQRFFEFVSTHPGWQQTHAPRLLADQGYLQQWKDGQPAAADLSRPVVNVSYYAASDYCEAQAGRLPSVLEWEYVAAASAKKKDASRDPAFVQQLLDWYSRPNQENSLSEVGLSPPNAWGVRDLHGLVWEWTADFNSSFVSGDNRRDSEQLKNLFCGSGAVSATDRANYAAFMRYALRSSLQGNYLMPNLGFRCAYDAKN